jgi:hypothetical protein
MIEFAVRAVLVANPGVAALIGARCYPVESPQAPAYPYVTYQVVTGEDHYHMEGSAGLATKRVQINCDGTDAASVEAVVRAVTAALGGFRGPVTLASSPPTIVRIQGAFKVMERDEPQPELQASGLRTLRKSLDFNIWFEE